MANIDEPIYLACRRALVGSFKKNQILHFIRFSIQGLDGSSEISGLLSNVQDIDALTEHVINVVRTKMREHNSIRVNEKKKEYLTLFENTIVIFQGYNSICSAIC
jgi:hypothetical protein